MKRSAESTGIALVGMAGRFPGATTLGEFWQNLTEGRETIAFASDEELLAAGVSSELIANPDYVRAAGSIRAPEYFDAAFFGFSAREAEIVDPQQRVFLECCWEALEDAGCDPSEYPGAIGVFAGTGMNTYGQNLLSHPEMLASVGFYQAMVGNDKDFLCSRVAYKLNLRGPAIGVQTACSTSLVAVQTAYESLQRRECDLALAGGVSIPLPQPLGYLYVPGMILSKDGHCRAFDAAASGTVPGAGAGIVALKRLGDAIEDGNNIYAVIQGAAINNDGAAKVGYTAPSVSGQQAVIRKSMEMAGFHPSSVRYVEAHGTGTEVGDPIEFMALAKAFESAVTVPNSCALGSLKTNIGHLDAAAGVAGLIKTALCIRHRVIPPTLHFTSPNPLLEIESSPFYVNSRLVRYEGHEPFRAGVSSFGIGGTNAHLSLEEVQSCGSDPAQGSQLIVLSAKTAEALDRRMSQLLRYLEETPNANIADIAFTSQVGRQRFQHRQALVVRDIDHAVDLLRSGGQAAAALRNLRAEDALIDAPPVAFLFPGQGAQFVNMGRNLYDGVPLFREIVDHCAEALQPHLGLDLRTVLYPAEDDTKQAERLLGQTFITQPAIFTVEYAMARLWMQCGISPVAMIGHSVGEYVAACLAGVFSLDDALAVIAERGRLIQSLPPGVMLAVALSEQDLSPLLSGAVSIAGVNSEVQTVASGSEEEIASLEAVLAKKKILCKRLRTSHAFHSSMMDSIVEPFVEYVRRLKINVPNLRYLSNVSGTWITAGEAVDPAYWGAHLRNAIRFADCARNLLREFDCVLLEVGPGETLGSLVRAQAVPNNRTTVISSMRHALASADDRDCWLTAMGKLWLKNVRLDWEGLHVGERRLRVSLPTYPFERQRYWIEPAKTLPTSSEPAVLSRQPDIADWFYVPSWKRALVGPSHRETQKATTNWLIFSEDDAIFQRVSASLGVNGVVVQVRAGSEFLAISPNSYQIRPDNPEDYRALSRDLMATQMWPERIVYLWKPKSPDCGIPAAIFLVQALEEEEPAAPIEFNVVTDRAYSVFGESISSPACGAQNAFWRVVSLECPNIKTRIVDVDLNSNETVSAEQILLELQGRKCYETIAYRGTSRWQQTYEPIRIEKRSEVGNSDRSIALRPGGTYLITGGLGGVGLVLARHIARKTQGRVVLTARTPLPPKSDWESLIASSDISGGVGEKLRGIQSIIEAGGEVVTLQADVSDASAMRDVMANIHRQYGTVHGIVHAAGLAGAGMIQMKTQEQVLSILSPKVLGTEWLCDYLPLAELDFVMLCSSINAVLPAFGLSDYAAANAYLDGFAASYDDPAGTRVFAVNWDTWREVGMAVNIALPVALNHEDRLKHAIRSDEAVEVFDRLLQFPTPQVVVSTRDLKSLQKTEAAFHPTEQAATLETRGHEQSKPTDYGELSTAGDDIEGFIVNLWQELLGASSIGIHDNFFQLGGHSLMGTQILSRVRERYRVNLPLRSVFEAVTPAELAHRIRVIHWAVNPGQDDSGLEREEIEL